VNPALITAADLCAFLDQHLGVEARAILSRGRILKAGEVVILSRIAQGGPVHRPAFAALVDRIMRRWALPPTGPVNCQPNTVVGNSEGAFRLTAPAGANASAAASSLERPAGEASNLPAGPLGEVEWTFTRLPDGRIALEEGC
jgi:hypothetical protein